MSLFGPTFHVTPVDLCIIFQCNLYISCIMSFGNKIFSSCHAYILFDSLSSHSPVLQVNLCRTFISFSGGIFGH